MPTDQSDKLTAVKRQISYVVLLMVALIPALPPAQAVDKNEDIPASLQPPGGEKLALRTHATGWQIYTCSNDSQGSPKWTLKAPDANLLDRKGKVVGHHSAGPVWKYKDGSEVSAKAAAHADSPDGKSIPWLLLTASGHAGKGKLANVTSVQRVHTLGGQPPAAAECVVSKINTEARSSYTADYYFYAPGR
jgi:hypothetical protein